VDGELAVIEGSVRYRSRAYCNLWVLRFDADGCCREFTEWYMKQPRTQ
jgi:hypothetical protein